jgi:hypothetical protein
MCRFRTYWARDVLCHTAPEELMANTVVSGVNHKLARFVTITWPVSLLRHSEMPMQIAALHWSMLLLAGSKTALSSTIRILENNSFLDV